MSSTPAKILYRPVGLVSGIVGGIIAGALFKQVWKRIGHEEDPPGALQSEYSQRRAHRRRAAGRNLRGRQGRDRPRRREGLPASDRRVARRLISAGVRAAVPWLNGGKRGCRHDRTSPRPARTRPEEWERGLAIVAHPDDIEYAAAAMARWTDQGKHIAYCLLTSGEAGIDGIDPEQSRPLREQEQRNAAAIVGVHDVEFLGYPDGTLE